MDPAADADAFRAALAEAADSLREAYPGVALPDAPAGPDPFVAILADSAADPECRRDVARVLALLAEQFPAALAASVPDLLDHLADEAAGPHLLAVLGHVSDHDPEAVLPATEPLVDLLDAPDSTTVRDATWALTNVVAADPDAIEAALPALQDLLTAEDEEVRRRAARAVAAVPPSHLDGGPALLERLLDMLAAPGLHRTAERALVSVAPAYGERVPTALFERLQTGRPAVREHAAATIERLARAHPGFVADRWPALLEAVRADDDHQVRRSAAAALAAIAVAESDEDLLDDLVATAEHEETFARRYACMALGDIALARAPSAVLETLATARNDEASVVAEKATAILADVAGEHSGAVAAVAPDLVDGSSGDS